MQVRIVTDNHIEGSERREEYYTDILNQKLKRFEDQITDIEMHLADENSSSKAGSDDKRCTIEVHISGKKPMAVTNHADTVEKSISGAIEKLKHLLEHTFDKMRTY